MMFSVWKHPVSFFIFITVATSYEWQDTTEYRSDISRPSSVCPLHYESQLTTPSWVLKQKWEHSHHTERTEMRVSSWMPTTGLNMIIMLQLGPAAEVNTDRMKPCGWLGYWQPLSLTHWRKMNTLYSVFSFSRWSTNNRLWLIYRHRLVSCFFCLCKSSGSKQSIYKLCFLCNFSFFSKYLRTVLNFNLHPFKNKRWIISQYKLCQSRT